MEKVAAATYYKDGNAVRNRANTTLFKWISDAKAKGLDSNTGGSGINFTELTNTKITVASNEQIKWLIVSYMEIIGNSRKFDQSQDEPTAKGEDSLKARTKTKPNVQELLTTIGDTRKRQLELLEDSDIFKAKKIKYEESTRACLIEQLRSINQGRKQAIEDGDDVLLAIWNEQLDIVKGKLQGNK